MRVKRGHYGGEWFNPCLKRTNVLMPGRAISTIPGPWRDLKKLANEKGPITKAFFSNLRVQVGEDSNIRFWMDPWLMGEPLKVVYRRLFIISSQKKEIISNMGSEGDYYLRNIPNSANYKAYSTTTIL